MLAHALMPLYNFCSTCFSVGLFLAMSWKNASKEKMIAQHNIQKTHIHIYILYKELYLNISQYLQESTCIGASF